MSDNDKLSEQEQNNDKLSDQEKELWDYYISQDSYTLQEFTTAMVGIGALLFAFASTFSFNAHPSTRIAIAVIGLVASLVLFWEMKSTYEDSRNFLERMKNGNSTLASKFEEFRSWRHKGWRKHWYSFHFFPSSKASRVLMLFVANVWFFLLLANLPQYVKDINFPSFLARFFDRNPNFVNPYLYSVFLLVSIAIIIEAFIWKILDVKRNKDTKTYQEIGLSTEQLTKVQNIMKERKLKKRDEAILYIIDSYQTGNQTDTK